MTGQAVFSPCGTYRYTLYRAFDYGFIGAPHADEMCNFIMLNPSTATATDDDPTVRRRIGYARRWGYGRLVVTNLFAYRAADPGEVRRTDDRVGPDNDLHIARLADGASLIVASWGNRGSYRRRDVRVRRLVAAAGKTLHCLALTTRGQPGHPLYPGRDLAPYLYIRTVRAVSTETPG